MNLIINNKFLCVSFWIISILIGIFGWRMIYQQYFSDEIFVKHNWKVGINHPTKSEIILDHSGELGMDGQVYTVYSYNKKEFDQLTKKHYWKKIDEKNKLMLKRRVDVFTKSVIGNSKVDQNDHQFVRHPIIVNEKGYYLIKGSDKDNSDKAIFILNPEKKQLYLLEEFN